MERSVPQRRYLQWAAVAVLCAGILLFVWLACAGLLGENLRTVVSQKCFRSGTMTAEHLAETIQREKIRTVINLRGEVHAQWQEDEARACANAGVKLENIAIALGPLPAPENVARLIACFEGGAYPMLWHCRNGADRAGLASTLYVMVAEKRALDEALTAQLTWRYGHLPIGKAASVDRFFELYRQTGNNLDIKEWVEKKYPAIYAQENSEQK